MKRIACFIALMAAFLMTTSAFAQDSGVPSKKQQPDVKTAQPGGNTVQPGGNTAQPGGGAACLPKIYLRTAAIKKGGAPVDKLLSAKPFKGKTPTGVIDYDLEDASGTDAAGWKVVPGKGCDVYIDAQGVKKKGKYNLKLKNGQMSDQLSFTL